MEHEYELVVVSSGEASESDRNNLIEEIKKVLEAEKGQVLDVQDWGKKQLAYEIKKNPQGYYTLITFKGNSGTPQRLNAKLKLMEEPLRYLIVAEEGGGNSRKN